MVIAFSSISYLLIILQLKYSTNIIFSLFMTAGTERVSSPLAKGLNHSSGAFFDIFEYPLGLEVRQ